MPTLKTLCEHLQWPVLRSTSAFVAKVQSLESSAQEGAAATSFDADKHLLLRDVAHQRCIHQDGEFATFVERVKAAGYAPFAVSMPDWPPVKRTPLPIIVFGVSIDGGEGGGSSMGGPTADMTWDGSQLAIERTWESRRDARRIAKEMAPDRMTPPHRMGYAWQVPVFDPDQHVVIRYWCRDNNVDIANFWRRFYPEHESELEIIETTNPELEAERQRGSYSPTRRCIPARQLYLLRNHYLGAEEEAPPAPEPVPQQSEPTPPRPAPAQPRAVHDGDGEEGDVQWSIHEGAKAIPWREAAAALAEALGREPRYFSGIGLDGTVVAITPEAMTCYLAENHVDRRQYIRDGGDRNFDCDDFAFTLRTALIRDHGYNCCAVIAGDRHAWCAFILSGPDGLEVAFIEPQTDGLVADLQGEYAIDKRCEVIL